MADICTDNRFELIERFKKKLIESTNIETSPEEMRVIDNILFRFWQMGWLDSIEWNKGEEYRKGWHDAISKALDEAYDIDIDGERFTVVQEETLLGLGMASEIPSENKGEWINAKVGKLFPSNDYKCSICGNILDFNGVNFGRGDANFCPNCGADMRGET